MGFVSDPDVVMVVALLVATVTLGLARGRSLGVVMQTFTAAIGDVASMLLLAWLVTVAIRLCVGSATVAGLTAAGILAPVVASGGVDPNLMVLAIGAGSLFGSHVNDAAFWMFKEYFGLSITDTLKSWTVMEIIVSVTGLGGVLLLAQVV